MKLSQDGLSKLLFLFSIFYSMALYRINEQMNEQASGVIQSKTPDAITLIPVVQSMLVPAISGGCFSLDAILVT